MGCIAKNGESIAEKIRDMGFDDLMPEQEKCIICEGKYSVAAVASTCTSEPVCKKHIEEIIKFLQEIKNADM